MVLLIISSNSPRFKSGIIPDTDMAGLTLCVSIQLISVLFFAVFGSKRPLYSKRCKKTKAGEQNALPRL